MRSSYQGFRRHYSAGVAFAGRGPVIDCQGYGWHRKCRSRERHALVKHRTQICNRLQALAHAAGLPKKGIQTKRTRAALLAANFTETQSFERSQLFELLDDLTERIKQIEQWLEEKAAGDAKVQLLPTHKGIGILSALAVAHTLGDVSRFPSSKEAVAYTGLDPLERSSARKVRNGSISKAGSSVLRHLLGQAMHVAARYDGELKAFYQRLANRRSKSIAKVAATRKLLIRLFMMLRDEIVIGVQKAWLDSWNARTVSWSEMTAF